MPRGDRTGPAGLGPMTGRAAGLCAGYGVPGSMNPVRGGGRGRIFGSFGRGGGRGWRNRYYATGMPGWARAGYGRYPYAAPAGPYAYGQPWSAQEEMTALREEADFLRKEVEAIEKRIASLEKEQTP